MDFLLFSLNSTNNNTLELIFGCAVGCVLAILTLGIYQYLKSPFQYPYFYHDFDVSGKKNPDIDNLIDEYIIAGNFWTIQLHQQKIKDWKEYSWKKIAGCRLKKYRARQFQACLDDNNAFIFRLTRRQTRYRQRAYVKTAYKVTQIIDQFTCDYTYLQKRNEKLRAINYECTLKDYHSKNQRKLMSKELKQKVIIRDHYTCQICGKYMPDGVGLQVDHIIPVSKGGKSILSNLQVLCSKCNGRKSAK